MLQVRAVFCRRFTCGIMHLQIFRERLPWVIRIVSGAVLVAISLGFSGQSAHSAAALVGDPVVLELFTSQGCSDCPPADALLNEVGASTPGVIPLAYHVDYWNHLGWADPFSSRQFSARQEGYSRAMKLAAQYTPQIVISGEAQFVGSDRNSIARAITEALATPAAGHVGLHVSFVAQPSRMLRIKVKAQVESSTPGPFVLMVAVYENGLVTRIVSGENGGRELRDNYTVRKLVRAFGIEGTQATEKEVRLELDPAWSINHLGVAAFIQNTSSLKIVGAAAQYPLVPAVGSAEID
jgi:hypothetical protein